MHQAAVTLDRADPTALSYVETVLADADLPTEDVRDDSARFYVATDENDDRVGVGGLEVHGEHGLLRSLAVEPDNRGRGYGTAICDALEARARDAGIQALYLLTTTASEFFAARGYEQVARDDAPAAIGNTTEFDALCPASATCMRLSLCTE